MMHDPERERERESSSHLGKTEMQLLCSMLILYAYLVYEKSILLSQACEVFMPVDMLCCCYWGTNDNIDVWIHSVFVVVVHSTQFFAFLVNRCITTPTLAASLLLLLQLPPSRRIAGRFQTGCRCRNGQRAGARRATSARGGLFDR